MEHQDWKPIVLNKPRSPPKQQAPNPKKEKEPTETRLEPPKRLGHQIMQARNAKKITQKQLAAQIGETHLVVNKWEIEKEIPTNAQLAKIERELGVKLPRVKKVKVCEWNVGIKIT